MIGLPDGGFVPVDQLSCTWLYEPLATSADAYLEQAGTPAFVVGWGAVYNGGPAHLARYRKKK